MAGAVGDGASERDAILGATGWDTRGGGGATGVLVMLTRGGGDEGRVAVGAEATSTPAVSENFTKMGFETK